ncbi:MAG: YDG domain-containing protein, partial [Paludibacter sp.]
ITYTLTDGTGLAANYSLATGSATGNITAVALTIGAASIAPKAYNASATSGTVTAGVLSGFVGSETVTVSTATGAYLDANVETGKTATITYTLTDGTGLAANYSLANGSATGNISAASQTITFGALSAANYGDGTSVLSASGGASGNVVTFTSSNDLVATCTGTNGTTLTIVGAGSCNINADQAFSTNYSVATQVPQSLTVNAKALTIGSASATSKMYNGTNAAVITGTLTGIINSDDVTLTGTGTFASSAVGTAISVTSTSTLGGTKAGNYSLTQPTGLTADITAAAVTINTNNATQADISGTTADVTVTGASTVLTVAANKTVNSITLVAGAKLNTTAGTLTAGTVTLVADKNTGSFSANLGAGISATSVRYLKTMDDAKWYFMSFPCDVTIADITKSNGASLGTLGVDWFIKYYDGAQRGTSGTSIPNWIPIVEADKALNYPTLHANQGYIFGLKTVGATYDVEFLFPLTTGVLASETTRTIPVAANNAGAIAATNHGWNLIGQPYLRKYNGTDAAVNFMTFSDGIGTYTQLSNTAATSINPMSAYFVQVDNSTPISFDLGVHQSVRSLVAASLSDNVQLNLRTATGIDHTNLVMSNAETTAYQIGHDLEKWIGTGTAKPQVYTTLGSINYAYNALPMASVVNLPIGFYTQTSVKDTISVDASQAPSLSKLLLTDTGVSPNVVTDLLLSDYAFTATTGTTTNRFLLTAQRIVTDNILIGNELGGIGISIASGGLILTNLSSSTAVRVYDAIGRTIVSKTTTNNTLEIKLNTRGIYTVQLQNGTSISTRKVIF